MKYFIAILVLLVAILFISQTQPTGSENPIANTIEESSEQMADAMKQAGDEMNEAAMIASESLQKSAEELNNAAANMAGSANLKEDNLEANK